MFFKLSLISVLLMSITACGDDSGSMSLNHCQGDSSPSELDLSYCMDYELSVITSEFLAVYEEQCTDTVEGTWVPDTLCTVAPGTRGCAFSGPAGTVTSWFSGAYYDDTFWSSPSNGTPEQTNEDVYQADCTADSSDTSMNHTWVIK